VIRQRTSLILSKDLIGLSGWLGMRTRDKLQKGRLKFSKTSLGQKHDKMMRLRQHGIDISSRCRRQHNSPYVWKDNQTEEDTTLCSENNFLRSY
jgi:hypothetical protein